jgi:hypothetical protein
MFSTALDVSFAVTTGRLPVNNGMRKNRPRPWQSASEEASGDRLCFSV